MTPTQLDHLRAIDAHLTALLDLAAKRTPGEWKIEPGNENELWGDSDYICDCFDNRQSNTAFIASCAGNAEAGWRSTKAAIKGLLLIEASETCADDAHGCNHPRDAFEILESILAEWPIENLTNNQ